MGRYEQPSYTVERTAPGYEVRHYATHLVAETVVAGGYDSTGTAAFRRLAGFIFGDNAEGRRLRMTVPVTHEALPGGAQRYRFMMERVFTPATVPRPTDERVRVVEVPAGLVAAAPYRGGRGERRFRRAEARLLAALERDGIGVTGPTRAAVYDGPTTPPFMRRNEVLAPVEVTPNSG